MMALALSVLLASSSPGADEPKVRKPSVDLRVVPRFGFSPVTMFFTAELKGGDDVEEYYCPEIEWDWDDGGKSVHEADCPPYEEGTKIERRFTAEHEYRTAGTYSIKVSLRRAGRVVASQQVKVTVRPGLGDPSLR